MVIYLYLLQILKSVGNAKRTGYWCIVEWESDFLGRLYGVYMFLLVLVIPVVLMTFSYGSISFKLWRLRYCKAVESNNK